MGMLFIRTPDGQQYFFGGVHAHVTAEAVVEAVNFALDVVDPQGSSASE
jgi:hypothetical protein